MAQIQTITGETVVAFRRSVVGARKSPAIRADERRGAVLLFTGIRYERGEEALARASHLLGRSVETGASLERDIDS